MLKKISASIIALMTFAPLMAQETAITPSLLQQYRENAVLKGSDKAIANALNDNAINTLATVSQNAIPGGTYFSHSIKSKGITNQKGSGRCWLFTGLNIMRAKMIQKYGLGEFELSENYVFFYDQLEKSNLFLQSIIDNVKKPMDDRLVEWLFKNPISDGGQFTGVADLISKYGVVPSGVMPETYSSENTTVYRQLISQKLREYGLALRESAAKGAKQTALQGQKEAMLGDIYRFLVRCFGIPPEKFTWTRTDASGKPVSTKEYTPKSFYDEYIGANLKENYIMFMNDPTREYYKTYEIDLDRHVYDGQNWTFVNLPMEELKPMCISSIKDSTMIYLSCDVRKDYDAKRGYSDPGNFNYADLMGTSFPMDKKERISTFASASTHAMSLMAVDLDEENQQPRKWMVENSWGKTSGYNGHIIMSDKWFSEYVFRLVIEKKYVPEKLQALTKQKPIRLPAWDPLFAPEE
ncbi:MAG: C1 family peptidase [Bacteroidaceae bacterium]|nr:C1 family peptidase [Bacteroidaceae bacterium]